MRSRFAEEKIFAFWNTSVVYFLKKGVIRVSKQTVRRLVLPALRACTVLAFALFLLRRLLLLPLQAGGDYEAVRSRPFFVPAPIERVCTYQEYIYILYGDSGAVNVYSGEGDFLWAVSVPWHSHTADTQMTGRDGALFLWQNRYDVYQYDLETGAYQGSFPQAGREEAFPMVWPRAERLPEAALPEGTVSYDALTVYRQTAAGRVPVVARGGWVRLLFFVNIWALGFFSLLLQILLEGLTGTRRRDSHV